MRAVTLGFSGQFTEDCQSHREREVVYSVYSFYSFEAVSILV